MVKNSSEASIRKKFLTRKNCPTMEHKSSVFSYVLWNPCTWGDTLKDHYGEEYLRGGALNLHIASPWTTMFREQMYLLGYVCWRIEDSANT